MGMEEYCKEIFFSEKDTTNMERLMYVYYFLLKMETRNLGDPANVWVHHSSKPLEDTIVRHSTDNNEKLTRSTCWIKQPRLLVVSVDVADGRTVTFDSYHEKLKDSENSLYDGDGIDIDHIMASGTMPEFYDYREIGGRKFCDGGWLSNTPFRELLQAHQDYWLGIIDNDKQKTPNLEVYIVNLHPSNQTSHCI